MDLFNLESLLRECNDPLTNNDRRREVERLIFGFDEIDNSWTFYLQILSTQNASELAYHLALSMLENKVIKKWRLLDDNTRVAIRSGIGNLVQQIILNSSCLQRQTFYVKKLLRLCADVARHDWPHEYPDFMDSVFQLCASTDPHHAAIGFVFLRTVSEEFTDERALFTTQRRAQLKNLFEQLLPRISDLIKVALQRWISTSSDDQLGDVALEALGCLAHLLTWAPLHLVFVERSESTRLLLVEMLLHVFAKGFTASSVSDTKQRNAAQLVLSCIAELFGRQRCLPKDANITLEIASALFQAIAQVVTPYLEARRNQDSVATDSNFNAQLSLLDGVTNCFSTFFATCFIPLILGHPVNREVVSLSDLLALLACYTLAQPDCDTLCSCLDIWVVCFEALVNSGQTLLPAVEATAIEFSQRLLVRAMFSTNQRELDELDDGDASISTYGKSGDNLFHEDDFDGNSDFVFFRDATEREYQLADGDGSDLPKAERFFVSVSSVVRQLAIAYPNKIIIDLLLGATQQRATFFVDITRNLVPERILNSNVRAVDAARIHCASRDLATLVALVAGVSDLLSNDRNTGYSVFSSLTALTHHSCHIVTHAVPSSDLSKPSPLREDLVRLHSRLFAAMRALFIHVARPVLQSALGTPKSPPDDMAEQLTQNITGAIDAAVQLMITSAAAEILQAAVPFLYACLTSRIPSIRACEPFSRMYPWLAGLANSNALSDLLSPPLWVQLCSGLAASLFLPHLEVRDNLQDWSGRREALTVLFNQLIAPCFNISFMRNMADRSTSIRMKWLRNSLHLVTAICRLVSTESPQSRQLVVNCIVMGPLKQGSADSTSSTLLYTCISLLSLWQRNVDIDGVLALLALNSAIINLQTQMESDDINRLIQSIMDAFPPSAVCASLLSPASQTDKYNHVIVAAFLSILRHIFAHGDFASVTVQKRNRPFLTAAIRFCLDDLRPAISSSIGSVLPAFIALLETIVADNWHFFSRKFGSTTGLGSLVDDIDRLEEANFPSLVGIVETLFSALLLPEIEVVRRAVAALNRLDTRCRLFSRQFVSASPAVITAISTTILTALQAGAHDLLRDEMLLLLYSVLEKANFASSIENQQSGFVYFFQTILPPYVAAQLPANSPVSNEILSSIFVSSAPVDQPTFSSLMPRIIADLRYHVAVISNARSSQPSLSLPSVGWLMSAVRSTPTHLQHHLAGAGGSLPVVNS